LKLLLARGAEPALWSMAEAGLLLPVLGGVSVIPTFAAMQKLEATLGLVPDPIRRLGSLAILVTEDAERLWQKLRLANVEHQRMVAMADGWWRVTPHDERNARALLYRLGVESFIDRVLMAWAHVDATASDSDWKTLATLPQRWTAPVFPIKAVDFIERGVAKGPALGAAMRDAEARWIAADFPDDAATLAQIVTSHAANAR
jgi:poly(A) polymerase